MGVYVYVLEGYIVCPGGVEPSSLIPTKAYCIVLIHPFLLPYILS